MFGNVHLGERAHVSDTLYCDGVLAEELHDLMGLSAQRSDDYKWCHQRTEQLEIKWRVWFRNSSLVSAQTRGMSLLYNSLSVEGIPHSASGSSCR